MKIYNIFKNVISLISDKQNKTKFTKHIYQTLYKPEHNRVYILLLGSYFP